MLPPKSMVLPVTVATNVSPFVVIFTVFPDTEYVPVKRIVPKAEKVQVLSELKVILDPYNSPVPTHLPTTLTFPLPLFR